MDGAKKKGGRSPKRVEDVRAELNSVEEVGKEDEGTQNIGTRSRSGVARMISRSDVQFANPGGGRSGAPLISLSNKMLSQFAKLKSDYENPVQSSAASSILKGKGKGKSAEDKSKLSSVITIAKEVTMLCL